ncbi:hypothetical protein AMELA_G00087010 [Ameiurus melas]|uniref:Uncharacterized protein n=1 Tax=Ameiurus melas TaxID=219545 RepID=A0A7J6AVE6_AMEME|nr:hypothetical protein AMELA_G00087010 [Ameiurus melas]
MNAVVPTQMMALPQHGESQIRHPQEDNGARIKEIQNTPQVEVTGALATDPQELETPSDEILLSTLATLSQDLEDDPDVPLSMVDGDTMQFLEAELNLPPELQSLKEFWQPPPRVPGGTAGRGTAEWILNDGGDNVHLQHREHGTGGEQMLQNERP